MGAIDGSARAASRGSADDRGSADNRGRLTWSLACSRLILVWERFEVAAWPPLALLAALLAVGFTGVLTSFPAWAHSLVLVLAAVIGVILIARALRRYQSPSEEEARRRLERVNGLAHHPLETLRDKPSQDDPIALAVWEEHRMRVAARLGKLSPGGPAPKLAGVDPFAFRITAVFLCVIALVGAGDRAVDNLSASLTPSFGADTRSLTVAIDAWLAPPDYTALPPIFIARADPSAVGAEATQDLDPAPPGQDHAVPVGSLLTVQVTGVETNVVLITPQGPVDLAAFAANSVAGELEITQSGPITVQIDGQPVRTWDIMAISDTPPEVEISETPAVSLRQALSIPYLVRDDYGVVSVRAEIERADRRDGSARSSAYETAEKIITPLPVPDRSKYGETRSVYRDYTAHPWAGGTVLMTLYAEDGIGQESRSASVELVLPERIFNHPVARAIVEARRDLAWDPARNNRAVRKTLHDLAWNHKAYGDEITVFLALREAERRLEPMRGRDLPEDPTVVAHVIDMLWKTALFLEDGGISLALETLRQAEQALMDAIADGAEMSEIDRLMDALQQAMDAYMEAMTEQLTQQMQEGDQTPLPDIGDNPNMLSSQDVDMMMEQMREMMRNGNTESAMEMLEQMRRMMENLQAGIASQMTAEGREAMEMLEGMQDLMESQRELMDHTYERAQQLRDGQQGQRGAQEGSQGGQGQTDQDRQAQGNNQGQGGGEGQGQLGENGRPGGQGLSYSDAILQNALRRQLGDIMRQFGEMMGEIPEPFGRADEGMAEAAQNLNDGNPADALAGQGQAMDALQDAAQSARNAVIQQFQNPMSLGSQMPGQTGQQGMDPFGREPSQDFRGALQGDVTVPDEGGVERSRQIRDELRRRSGDRSRPQQELDYIDRLLDPFQ